MIVTVPDLLLSAFPIKSRVQAVPGAKVPPQSPPVVKFEEDVIEEIDTGTLLTFRNARIGLTRGERLSRGMLLGEILAKNDV